MLNFPNSFFGPNDRRKNGGNRRNTDERKIETRRKPGVGDTTIATISPYWRTDPDSPPRQDVENLKEDDVEQQTFKIRMAQSTEHVNSASLLVQRKYASRGLEASQFQNNPWWITLMAYQGNKVTGTLTLGLESPDGLLADELYKSEIDSLRKAGHKVCELTKLAVDQHHASKHVLAALFHIAYIYGRIMHRYTDVVIEVNPRHVAFYKRMMGFKEFGPERLCGRVNAPGVLLRLELDYVDRQIESLGGKTESAKGVHSLYPYFFSKEDEEGITQRLLRGE